MDYGYDIVDEDREQQFRCDLHGVDHKPSARFYPKTNSTYCWVCQKARGPVDYYAEREGVDITAALLYFERLFQLPTWVAHEADQEYAVDKLDTIGQVSADEVRKRFRKTLLAETRDRSLGLAPTLALWDSYDRITFALKQGDLTEREYLAQLTLLREDLRNTPCT